jgi:hypothetical protein
MSATPRASRSNGVSKASIPRYDEVVGLPSKCRRIAVYAHAVALGITATSQVNSSAALLEPRYYQCEFVAPRGESCDLGV